ncbi:unnamed protein product [Caenorhabditis sp. 36 PRJEB53466]|nr:unnamed protein product [Caenorhabditis sp. 36 PRJEB53466]
MLSLDVSTKKTELQWAKEESLINTASVEMVDLPLSESQQMIEDEFEEGEQNIISAFMRRLQVQFGQLCRLISKSVEKIVLIGSSLSIQGNGLSDFIQSVRTVSNSIGNSALFERDYFNLRKVIIVATTDGTVFGIDSNDGNILWKIWLGEEFNPLEVSTNTPRVPLFVQRTTAHYQLEGLASVIYSKKMSKTGVILSFNPMIGKITTKTFLDYPIKRITLLPTHAKEHVLPVMVIGQNNEITINPSVSKEELDSCPPLHLIDIDSKSHSLRGLKVDLSRKIIDIVWNGYAGLGVNDEIIAVKGKPFNQKVHSQGRVLTDRDVQYKYVNPNLAAIASLDKSSQQLSIVLVDIVTGQVVHSASFGKAGGPIHLVHSENWIAYAYWSEKGRRTELGIIELYEGSEKQFQKEMFDSYLLNKQPAIVMSQSYIYAHGIDSMTVSETEKGLTTRSLLLALPAGGIHEVSRKLLDATRPMDLTPALREEMVIGYMPEIAAAPEEMINYNKTVYRVKGIKTSSSGLESTSLVLAFGTDLFFTRLVPSGTFDILKDDFDHILISTVLTGLVFGSYVTKQLARSNALASQWS